MNILEDTLIFGKPFDGSIVPLFQLDDESGIVIVEGMVFALNHRQLQSGDWIVQFDLCDHTESICVTNYMSSEQARPILNRIQKGDWLRVRGKTVFSRFQDETVLHPFSIQKVAHAGRVDNAPEKRVELHLHTKMSAMDGLIDVKEAIQTAKTWDHRAVGITDTSVVQAFPAAMRAANRFYTDAI